MKVMAPGVIKLLGEHASVYGYTCVAAAINLYITAQINKHENKDALEVVYSYPKPSKIVTKKDEMISLFKSYSERASIAEYANNAFNIKPKFLPHATIASRLYCQYGANVLGKSVNLYGKLPVQRGLASSAASSVAFAVSFLKGSKFPGEEKLIDVARDGERVVHRNEHAGMIDVLTSFYGGCVSYSSQKGAKKEKINAGMEFLIVDTGPKKSTAETVGHVAELYKNNKKYTEGILHRINKCVIGGIVALKEGDARRFGNYMFLNHELLKCLEVSSTNLDKMVKIAKEQGALGAKLSGGGGGGAGIVLVDESTHIEDMINEFKDNNFGLINARISPKGAYDYLAILHK